MNNNGKGIFSGIIGVATLIVAIIGATFAYFTANSTSNQYVTGTAATAGLNVSVLRMTGWSTTEGDVTADTAAYIMVPQLDSALSAAIRGYRTRPLVADSEGREPGTDGYVDTYSQTEWEYGAPCIDSGGSLVCSIYKIVVQNTGSAPITVSGKIEFMGTSNVEQDEAGKDNITNTEPGEEGPVAGNNKMNHLKWARLAQPEAIVDGQYTYAEAIGSSEGTTPERIQLLNTTPIALVDYTLNNSANEPYQTTEDGQKFYYADTATTVNQYLYGMEVEDADNVDLLNGVTITGAHKAHFDIVDPTNDLDSTYKTVVTPTADGRWYLAANGNNGDTKIFYIAVWISENNQTQNKHDQGQFTGMVTFNSSEGSGATSTFTQPYID